MGVPARQHTPLHAQELLHRVFLQDLVVRSGTEWEIPRHPQPFRPNSNYGNMAAALRWLAEGSIRLGDLYEVRPPTDPQTIYQDILHQRLTRPAVVLDWRGIE